MTSLNGTGHLIRLVLRRDRIRLPVWIFAQFGLTYASAAAVRDVYGTAAQQQAYARTIGSSAASIAFSGPPVGLDTIGGITANEVNQSAILVVSLMAIFLTVRHTRGEEQDGRVELVRAAPVGVFAPVAAALLVVGSACLAVGALTTAALLAAGLPTGGSVAYGVSIAAVGLAFTGIAACSAQVTEYARGAVGLAGALFGLSYAVRAVGDVSGSWLVWLSPIGWAQAVHAFAGARWWPLLLCLGFAAAVVGAAVALLTRRDLGAGLVPPRPGPAYASRTLTTPAGFAARLQRGALIGWAAGVLLLGLVLGSLSGDVRTLVEDNPTLRDALGVTGAADVVDAYLATALLMMGLLVSGYAVSSVLRLRAEEASGRAELLLGTGLSRGRWTGSALLVTVVACLGLLLVGALGVGVATALSTGEPGQVWRLAGLAPAYLPATLVVAGVAVLLVGWAPRAALAAWGFLSVCLAVGWLGGLIDFPAVMTALSPFEHVPQVPSDPATAGPLLTLGIVAAALTGAGLAGVRRRDVG